jgi:alkylhydroperoxidase/carboxymuconolactone decarboxylase family protein YurZ
VKETSAPPKAYQAFRTRFPKLGQAWDLTREASSGPIDESAASLIKLGISIGAMREGAVHSAVRKAVAAGASREAIEQVVALSASTLGFPATVAVYTWVREVLDAP